MVIRTKLLDNRFLLKRNLHSSTELPNIINSQKYESDSFTNISSKIMSLLSRNLYVEKYHPICLVKERIIEFFYKKFTGHRGNPIFSVHENLSPVVSVEQNFDSLLVPKNHSSRSKNDCYYLNKNFMLRGHMTAHQSELIKMGLNNFLMVGDVYRRDTIDATHYPVFHQLDAVRLLTGPELDLGKEKDVGSGNIKDPSCSRTKEKQGVYTIEASKIVEKELKSTLEELTKELFGSNIEFKWVEAYFPFTHPSWEMEILFNGKWVEMLGCGVMENDILKEAGCGDQIGWAFGMGLERLAMMSYSIPDIRLFWTKDSGFHQQFHGKKCTDKVIYKPFSVYPPCPFDISFWTNDHFEANDFYEIARDVGEDTIEQIHLIDKYECKKTHRVSYCFRIVYRSMEKTLTKEELRTLHARIEKQVVETLNVVIR